MSGADIAGGIVAGLAFIMFGIMIIARGLYDIYEAGSIDELNFIERRESRGVALAGLGILLLVLGALTEIYSG